MERTMPLVIGIASKFNLPREEVEDVAQEAYVALYQNLGTLRFDEAIPRWLAVTSARLAKRAQDKRSFKNVNMEHPDFEAWETAAALRKVPLDQQIALKDGIKHLPEKCQEVLNALFFEQLSYSEASEKLDVAMGSLGPIQSRCLQRLADYLNSGSEVPTA